MKARLAPLGALIALCLLFPVATQPATSVPSVGAAVPLALRTGPGSTLWLEGTSTLHDFESRTDETAIAMTRGAASSRLPDTADLVSLVRASAIRTVEVTVPVRSLHSRKSAIDKNLWKAMKAGEHKNISVHLDHFTLPAKEAAGDTLTLRAVGTITIAGEQRSVTLEGRIYSGSGGMWLEGNHAMRMSEFGIRPPTMMLGTVRVGDPVTIHYRLLLVRHDDAGISSANSGH